VRSPGRGYALVDAADGEQDRTVAVNDLSGVARFRIAATRTKARQDTDLAPIVRFTPEERAAYLERQTQREMGISVAEFRRAFAAGELDNHHAVSYLAGKILISQNGSKAAA